MTSEMQVRKIPEGGGFESVSVCFGGTGDAADTLPGLCYSIEATAMFLILES